MGVSSSSAGSHDGRRATAAEAGGGGCGTGALGGARVASRELPSGNEAVCVVPPFQPRKSWDTERAATRTGVVLVSDEWGADLPARLGVSARNRSGAASPRARIWRSGRHRRRVRDPSPADPVCPGYARDSELGLFKLAHRLARSGSGVCVVVSRRCQEGAAVPSAEDVVGAARFLEEVLSVHSSRTRLSVVGIGEAGCVAAAACRDGNCNFASCAVIGATSLPWVVKSDK